MFENVTVQPSPLWLQYRLTAIGLNPINNIVDLTNFLMAELAQPMHAFDRAKLHGDTIWARPAREGERLVALNDEEYMLTPSNLVIADAAGPIALAGVIGGRDSAISAQPPRSYSKAPTSRRPACARPLPRSSCAPTPPCASRNRRTRTTPSAPSRGPSTCCPMLSPLARLVGGLADCAAPFHEPPPVPLDLDWLARKLGRELDADKSTHSEEPAVRGDRNPAEAVFRHRAWWRATKDVAMPEDLVEEVGRMIGYDSIEPQAPLVSCAPSFDPPEREFLRGVKRAISAQGFTEVSNYSFISEEEARRFGFAIEDHVRVLNPIAAGQELLRTSLLPGIHRNIVENAKHFDRFRIFEIGHEIHKGEAEKPDERPHLMAALFSKEDESAAGLLELKRTAECLAPGLHVRPATPRSWEHPARCAELWWNGREFGRLSELHPRLMENGRAAVLDIDLTALQELTPSRPSFKPIPRFPTSAFDLSVIADARELAGTLELEIRRFAGDLAETIEYVREYQGERVPAGKKSVSFRVVASAPDRTLSSNEITSLRNRIIEGLNSLGYELRV